MIASETKNKNIYEEEAAVFTPEAIRHWINELKAKGFKSILIFNDKDNDEFNKVEALLKK